MARHSVTRIGTTVSLTLAVLVVLPSAALAHASFDVSQLSAGASQQLVLRVPLEREAANDRVEVLVPGAFTVDACDGAEGWGCQQEATADGNTVLAFERAPEGPGDTQQFALTVTAPQEEGVYPFPTIQTYDDGQEAAWIGEPGSDHPAPRIQVGDETAEVESSGDAAPHTEPTDEPTAAPSATADAESSPGEAVTDEPTAAATAPPDGDDGDGAEGLGGAVLAIAVAVVVAVVAAVTVIVLRRRRR